MDITFRTKKLEKQFNSGAQLQKDYGLLSKRIMARMGVLKAASNLSVVPIVPPERCHALGADRQGQFAVDLNHPHRLVFEPNHDPIPLKEDGGVDLTKVTAITIIKVIDYH